MAFMKKLDGYESGKKVQGLVDRNERVALSICVRSSLMRGKEDGLGLKAIGYLRFEMFSRKLVILIKKRQTKFRVVLFIQFSRNIF